MLFEVPMFFALLPFPLMLATPFQPVDEDYRGGLIDTRGVCVDPDPALAEILARMELAETRTLKELDAVRPSLPHTPITIDVQHASVRSLFRMLAQTGDINIVLHDSVEGELTLQLTEVPWDQVLDVVLLAGQLDAVAGENLIVVYPLG